jgi:putative Holliday junction resolvase
MTQFDNRNILAIDYGQKFTGLATFAAGRDPFPTPYGRIAYQNDTQLVEDILKIIQNEAIEVAVVGVPFLTDGTATNMTKIVQSFINLLKSRINIPVYEQDETLSSFEAKDRMKNSPRYNFKINMQEIDAVAASIILEDFMKNSTNNL